MDLDVLTPAQRRTLDGLMARRDERPVFAPDLGDRLRVRIAAGVEEVRVPCQLRLNKHRLNDLGRCEGLFAAGLLGEGAPFQHRAQTAAGSLAHKAIELDVPRQRVDPVAELVSTARERLREDEPAFGAFWDVLDAVRGSEVEQQAVRLVEQFRMSFPPLERRWSPITEFPVRVVFGPVSLSGRVDLMLGGIDRDEPTRARRLVLDLKSGRAWPEFPEDMRLYALLLALRCGVPPFRVASVFLDSGEWQAEDVTEETLFHAADRVIRSVQTAAAVLRGDQPELRPGPYCGWCPRAQTCPVSSVRGDGGEAEAEL